MESKKDCFFSFDETITKILYICFLIDGHQSKLPFILSTKKERRDMVKKRESLKKGFS